MRPTPLIAHPHIRSAKIFKLALRNLLFKRSRSTLTVLGVMMGIGLIFGLLSFGLGLQRLVQQQVVDGKLINTVDVTSASSKIIALTPENLEKIAAVGHVKAVSGTYVAASKLSFGGSSVDVATYGIDGEYLKLTNLGITIGEQLDPSRTDQVVVSKVLLEAVGIRDPKSALGKQLKLEVDLSEEKSFTASLSVAGIIDSGNGSEVFISGKLFAKADAPAYASGKALVDSRDNIAGVRRGIESLGFTTASPVDTLDQVDQFFRVFSLLLVGLGSISVLVAILGMVNTLTVSLLERTKEISLMIAIGARPKDMHRLFTCEALLLAVIGGIAGMVGVALLAAIIDVVLNSLARGRGAAEHFSVFAFPLWLPLVTLAAVFVIGLLVALAPARRAARINPIDAMRMN